jgi:histidinol dehydrogenase
LQQGVDLINALAPEHLELLVEDPLALLGQVQAAGAVFVGPSSPVPLGDYIAGPSHVLPTGRAARFSSGLSVWDFVTCTSVVWASPQAAAELSEEAILLAQAEGLTAHAAALRHRLLGPPLA